MSELTPCTCEDFYVLTNDELHARFPEMTDYESASGRVAVCRACGRVAPYAVLPVISSTELFGSDRA